MSTNSKKKSHQDGSNKMNKLHYTKSVKAINVTRLPVKKTQ